MSVEHLVVVGASLAGLRAAEAARKAGFTGRLTLIGAEEHLPYDRPPLSKAFLEAADEPPAPTYRDRDVLTGELGVELRLGTSATGLDADAREVVLANRRIGYDALVITTGATARPLPGTDGLAGIHTLRTLDDARAVREALDAGARTVVVGAGFIGSEVASSARKRGGDVTIVEALSTPLTRAVGELMGSACSWLHARHGTELRCGVTVTGLHGVDRVRRVTLSDGSVLEADLVIVGTGAIPAVGWLAGSGVTLTNGVRCDETLATSVPGVYAAGDVACWHNPLYDRPMRLEHWTSAAEQGAVAARNALDPANAKPYATVPYFWSDWYDSRIQFVGIPDADEIVLVTEDPDGPRLLVLYRTGDRLTGALGINQPAEVMKYRSLIMRRASWAEAQEFAAQRALKRASAA